MNGAKLLEILEDINLKSLVIEKNPSGAVEKGRLEFAKLYASPETGAYYFINPVMSLKLPSNSVGANILVHKSFKTKQLENKVKKHQYDASGTWDSFQSALVSEFSGKLPTKACLDEVLDLGLHMGISSPYEFARKTNEFIGHVTLQGNAVIFNKGLDTGGMNYNYYYLVQAFRLLELAGVSVFEIEFLKSIRGFYALKLKSDKMEMLISPVTPKR